MINSKDILKIYGLIISILVINIYIYILFIFIYLCRKDLIFYNCIKIVVYVCIIYGTVLKGVYF